MRRWLKVIAGAALLAGFAATDTRANTVESAGTDVAIALPIVAGGISVVKDDWTGVAQLVVDTGLTVGTAYALKHVVREERPDHSGFDSFPSDTAALASAPAAYLWDRYGWQYGLPAYLAVGFVDYSRVDARKHHWWDVVTSTAMAWGYSQLITTEFRPNRRFTTGLYISPAGGYVVAKYQW